MTTTAPSSSAPFPPRRPARFPKSARLLLSGEFSRVDRQGQRASGALVIVVARRAGTRARVGLTVSKKVGNAVVRNATKRRLREIVRGGLERLQGLDVVIIAKPEAAGQSIEALDADVWRTLDAALARLRSRPQQPARGRGGSDGNKAR